MGCGNTKQNIRNKSHSENNKDTIPTLDPCSIGFQLQMQKKQYELGKNPILQRRLIKKQKQREGLSHSNSQILYQ